MYLNANLPSPDEILDTELLPERAAAELKLEAINELIEYHNSELNQGNETTNIAIPGPKKPEPVRVRRISIIRVLQEQTVFVLGFINILNHRLKEIRK